MHSMEIKEIYYNTFYEKFREINVLTKEVTKELISRKKKFGEREFHVFPHCEMYNKVDGSKKGTIQIKKRDILQ